MNPQPGQVLGLFQQLLIDVIDLMLERDADVLGRGKFEHAREALTLYLETLTDNGDPIPEETTQEPVSLGITVRTPIIT